MTEQEYRSLDRLSKSELDLFARCPALYKYNKMNKIPATQPMEFGTALHCMILEPEKFEKEYSILPQDIDRRTRDGKATHAKFVEELNGRIILSFSDYDKLTKIKDSYKENKKAVELIETSRKEVSILWDFDGVELKSRIDGLNLEKGYAIDLKTTQDASLYSFTSSATKFRYDVQASFYTEAVKYLTGEKFDFYFLAVEKDPPYLNAIYIASPFMIQFGQTKWKKDLDLYRKCLKEDRWPSYNNGEIVPLVTF